MRVKDWVKIDPEYLKSQVAGTGMSQEAFSKHIGQGPSCIPNAIHREHMRGSTAAFICRTMGWDADKLLVPEKKPEPEPEKQPTQASMDESIRWLANSLIAIDKKLEYLTGEVARNTNKLEHQAVQVAHIKSAVASLVEELK
jgi:hypothetical protein